jgi:hypothetical protein
MSGARAFSPPPRGAGPGVGGVQTLWRLRISTPPLTLPSPPQGGRGF